MKNKINLDYLVITLNDNCNLNCTYCLRKLKEKPINNKFTFDNLKEIYDKYEPNTIMITGGEPTLQWNDILKFIKYVVPKMENKTYLDKIYYQNIIITTNGTIDINFENIPQNYRYRLLFTFSIDGFEELTDKNRGKGTYKKVIESIKKCRDAKIPYNIMLTRNEQEFFTNLEEFIQYMNKEFGIHAMCISPILKEYTDFQKPKITLDENYLSAVKSIKEKYPHLYLTFKYVDFGMDDLGFCIGLDGDIHWSMGGIYHSPSLGKIDNISKTQLLQFLNICKYYNFNYNTILKNFNKIKQGLIK